MGKAGAAGGEDRSAMKAAQAAEAKAGGVSRDASAETPADCRAEGACAELFGDPVKQSIDCVTHARVDPRVYPSVLLVLVTVYGTMSSL